MFQLSELRIQSRLFLLLFFSVLALGSLGAFSALTIQAETSRATAFIDGEFESVRALSEIRAAIDNARLYEKDIFLTMGDEAETDRFTALWKAEVLRIQKTIEHAQALAQPDESVTLVSMLGGVNAYAKGFNGLLGQMTRGELNDPWAANTAMKPMKSDIQQADKALADLSKSILLRVNERRSALAITSGQAPWIVVGATTLVSAFATLLVLAIVRSILLPIKQLQATADAWGQCDLSAGMDGDGQDEIADVKRGLGRMHQALTHLVTQVRSGVDVVHGNTTEIASANSDLSERTEQAAVSLQKTAESVQQLSLAVKHTAQSATQAVGSAAAAMRVAQRGGEVVAKVVSTMDDINTSSSKIAEILQVIDGIAFQTNILALNAAVEAARAGEQGRGFAVVASEVRSLAGRSADAARQIKNIIASSVDSVKVGSELVQNAGQTMREIVESVGQVSIVIEDIRVAAHAQLEGIGMISTAMDGLDQATQQNAAMVEESAAGTISLAEQTQHLRNAVATFNLEKTDRNSGMNVPLKRISYA